jgi:hypothetical protein
MANSDSKSIASALVASTATQNHPPNRQLPQVIFTQPNMNHNLNIKLSKRNFLTWRTQILAYIKGQDSYGLLDGSSQPPTQTILNPATDVGAPTTIVNPKFLTWSQRDQMILNVLISTLTEPYVVHTIGCATSSALWTTLITMSASQACARVMQIHFQLATVKKGNNSITEYFSKQSRILVTHLQPLVNLSMTLRVSRFFSRALDPNMII